MDVIKSWLEKFVSENGGVAGTVHFLDGDDLVLAASHNIPPPVVELTRRVPRGKGMAGQALLREEPVQTCNLKDDNSGVVRPGAKAVDAQRAIALPVMRGERVRAVVGIAFMGAGEFAPDEIERYLRIGATLPDAP